MRRRGYSTTVVNSTVNPTTLPYSTLMPTRIGSGPWARNAPIPSPTAIPAIELAAARIPDRSVEELVAAVSNGGAGQPHDDGEAPKQAEIDVAEAMSYNEYAQLVETVNPDTGELYQPEDFVIIDYNEVGTAMLQDAVHARASWLAEEGNEEVAAKFLAGVFKGWAFCRDNP